MNSKIKKLKLYTYLLCLPAFASLSINAIAHYSPVVRAGHVLVKVNKKKLDAKTLRQNRIQKARERRRIARAKARCKRLGRTSVIMMNGIRITVRCGRKISIRK